MHQASTPAASVNANIAAIDYPHSNTAMASSTTSGLGVPRDTDRPVSSAASTLAGERTSVDEKPVDTPNAVAGADPEKQDSESVMKGEQDPGSSDELSEDEYPKGIKLAFIVVALVLSIFLLSLDMVRFTIIPSDGRATTANTGSDHCRDGYSQNHRRVQGSRQGRVVRRRLLHDRRRFPVNV